ncbi:hypothetical protein NIIDNTM18_49780 [Mycolicibacterium litorale]|uniref:Uncharacterized protein n=1 Tax=Mycolicibacterium litorale TaxID=758802 RepID=A0A6S6PGN4_9MYCO|nr:hypothetical protein [Mycolicibacterium litorale]BCI55700.1 hypothetical protein NIIDNTM18_49780 [Mycolicibacterium litorale]
MTSNQEVLRLYIKEVDPHGYDRSASDEEVLQTSMDYSAEVGVDIDDAARSLELAAQRFDISINDLVAAATALNVYTLCGLREALWQLERVIKVVRQIEGNT